jgi:hypothetical protein
MIKEADEVMWNQNSKVAWFVLILSMVCVGFLYSQTQTQEEGTYPDKPATGTEKSMGAKPMTFKAMLVDEKTKAEKKNAVVKVTVTGIKMVDPALVNEKPRPGQGHIHYQVDDGPIIATPSLKLSLHELKPGEHTIKVTLVGNDHKPLGPEETLTVTIP